MYLLFIPWLAALGVAVWRPRWAIPIALGSLAATLVWAMFA